MHRKIHRQLRILVGLAAAFAPAAACAQICGPTYSVQPQRVMEQQIETRLRVVYDLVYEDQQITTQRPVLKTRTERRSYSVNVPVVETSTLEERYTVRRPVTKREWVDQSYNETTYITETAEREEAYTTFHPVVETSYVTQNYVVQRPVTETQLQTQQYTTLQPVTTYQNTVVDQGQYVAQQYFQPGDTRYGLRWLPGGYAADPQGYGAYRRGGMGWVPYTSPGNTFAQLMYQPNPVQVAVPQTSLMPQVQQVQVPVTVTKMQAEVVEQQVPVSTTRMEAVQQTRKVPYSVQKPVTRRVERMVPVDRVEYVDQEMVRPKTIERTTFKIETVEREVPVQYYETEAVVTSVKVPRRVPRYEEYRVLKWVSRVVQSPVVLSYADPYSVPLSMGVSPWLPSGNQEKVTYGEPRAAGTSDASNASPSDASNQPSDASNQPSDASNQPSDASNQPSDAGQSLRKIEIVVPQVEELPPNGDGEESSPSPPSDSNGIELSPPAGADSTTA